MVSHLCCILILILIRTLSNSAVVLSELSCRVGCTPWTAHRIQSRLLYMNSEKNNILGICWRDTDIEIALLPVVLSLCSPFLDSSLSTFCSDFVLRFCSRFLHSDAGHIKAFLLHTCISL